MNAEGHGSDSCGCGYGFLTTDFTDGRGLVDWWLRFEILAEGCTEVFHAFGGEGIGGDVGVEYLDGDPTVVAAFDEFGGDGREVDGAHAGALEVGVVRVEVGCPWEGVADGFRDGFAVGGHGLDVEVEADVGRVDFFQEGDGLGGGVDEIRFRGAEEFEGDGDISGG